jgi:transposase
LAVLARPDVERDGVSAFTIEDIRLLIEEQHGVRYHINHVGELIRRMGLSRQKARPSHPKKDEAAAAASLEKDQSDPHSGTIRR